MQLRFAVGIGIFAACSLSAQDDRNWPDYGGGLGVPGTFVEYAKTLIDQQHAWHSQQRDLVVDPYTESISGLHVYDSVMVLDKGRVPRPSHRKTGIRSPETRFR